MTNAGSYSYVYDGTNKRVKQADSHGTSYSFYGSNGKLMYRKEGGTHVDYYYLGDKLVANRKGSTVTYLHSDYLGSTAARSTASGSVNAQMRYQPFGEKIGTAINDIGYTGHKLDTDLGLSYMEARYYDPVLGRFMVNDPVGFDAEGPMTFNRYSYADNNPYKFVDPDGKETHIVGIDLDLVAPAGGGVSIGLYFNSGRARGEKFDFGVTGSVREALGIDASVGITYSKFFGNASKLNGLSKYTELGVGAAEIQVSETEDWAGDSGDDDTNAVEVGFAYSPLPAGAQIGHELTGKVGFQDVIEAGRAIADLAGSGAIAIGNAASTTIDRVQSRLMRDDEAH